MSEQSKPRDEDTLITCQDCEYQWYDSSYVKSSAYDALAARVAELEFHKGNLEEAYALLRAQLQQKDEKLYDLQNVELKLNAAIRERDEAIGALNNTKFELSMLQNFHAEDHVKLEILREDWVKRGEEIERLNRELQKYR